MATTIVPKQSTLPPQYAFLAREPGPRILIEALKTFGTVETAGKANNPTIMGWAKKVGLAKIYKADSTAWCGLWMAYVAGQAGWPNAPLGNALWARNWAAWGDKVMPGDAKLGDVLVFKRGSGGHVALYVGEDITHYHILGGNQDDQVSIRRRLKSSVIAIRRCDWRINQPANVRKIKLLPTGVLSTKES
jgi:uncharacterized protein (TIGR02594 family)